MLSAAGRLRVLVTDRLVHYACRQYLSIILISTALTAVGVVLTSRLSLNTDLASLLPDDYPSVQHLNLIRKQVGHTRPLLVLVSAEQLADALGLALTLADTLDANALLSSISLRTHRDFFLDHRLLYMEIEDLETLYERFDEYLDQKILEQSPLYVALDPDEETTLDVADLEEKYRGEIDERGLGEEFYLTRQKDGVVLRLYPTGDFTDMDFTNRLLDSVAAAVEVVLQTHESGARVRVEYSGSFVNQASDYNLALQDARSTALYGMVGVVLLLMVYFRQILAPLFVIVPLGMSLCWTFGFTYLVIGSLNQVTMVLFAVLFGLGIDFGIHILARYREAWRRLLDLEEALTETIGRTGRALATTAVTTSLAFSSLMIMDFKAFSHFGFIVGVGVIFALLAMIVVVPAFIVVAERLRVISLDTETAVVAPGRGAFPLSRISLALAAVAGAYSLYHLGDLAIEYDFTRLRYTPQHSVGDRLPAALQQDTSPAIVLTDGAAEALAVVEKVKSIMATSGDSTTVASVKSVYSALPADQPRKMELITALRKRLGDDVVDLLGEEQRARVDSFRELLSVEPLTLEDLPPGITAPFTAADGRILPLVAINSSLPLHDAGNAMRFSEEISRIELDSGRIYHASSSNIVFADIMRVVFSDGKTAVVMALVIVFFVVLLDFRRVRDAALVVVPLLAALLWVCGFMYVFDIEFNLYNVIVFPTLIGMGVANTVHILHRYREEGPGSLRLVLRTTGKALAATSLTTMAGFSGLVIVSHPGLNSMGTVALIGLANCFLAAVVLLPALLQLLESRAAARPA